jgi:two-component system response regulator YesN
MELLPRLASDELPSEIRRAIRIIEEGYREPLLLAEVAEAVGLGPFHFSRLFHTSTGLTFREYVIRFRLQHACRLLADPGGPSVTRVGLEVGFGSVRNLERLFHERIGMSPSEFRRRSARPDGSC